MTCEIYTGIRVISLIALKMLYCSFGGVFFLLESVEPKKLFFFRSISLVHSIMPEVKWVLIKLINRSSCRGAAETNLTRNHEVEGLIPWPRLLS